MKSIKFELNTKGFMEQVLKSNGMQEAVQMQPTGSVPGAGTGTKRLPHLAAIVPWAWYGRTLTKQWWTIPTIILY